MSPDELSKILDVGFSNKEYSPVDNYIEKNYVYPQNVTALGIEEYDLFEKRYPRVKVVRYNGRDFPFQNKEFDVVWSNAVIEHVGEFDQQVYFVKEMTRVGRRVYFSTPNRSFPIEVHSRIPLLHWLPDSVFHPLARLLGKGFVTGNYMRLLTAWNLRKILKFAGIEDYKLIKKRKFGLTLDFVVVI